MKVIAVLVFLLPSLCLADDLWIIASTISHHFNTDEKYNEHNPGLGLEYGGDKLRLIAGEYTNSFSRHSTYWGVLYMPLKVLKVRFGGALGIVNGYPINDGRYTPAATLAASYETLGFGINLIGTPKITNVTPMALALQIKAKF